LGGSAEFDPAKGIRDVRLAERALRERWDVPEDIRTPLLRKLAVMALKEQESSRKVASIVRTLLAAGQVNLQSIGVSIAAEAHETLKAEVDELKAMVAALKTETGGQE
jgi:hypothetical protein